MSITNTYAFPAAGNGFDRGSSLASFDSAAYLVTADYQLGFVYIYNGAMLSPIVGSNPLLFGSFIHDILGGQLTFSASYWWYSIL